MNEFIHEYVEETDGFILEIITEIDEDGNVVHMWTEYL